MITVVNVNHGDFDGVYIGRGSPLGNPFRINQRQTRDEVIDRYEEYIREKIASKDQEVCAELNKIFKAARAGNVNLKCFCSPDRCHGDVIKKLIEEKL